MVKEVVGQRLAAVALRGARKDGPDGKLRAATGKPLKRQTLELSP